MTTEYWYNPRFQSCYSPSKAWLSTRVRCDTVDEAAAANKEAARELAASERMRKAADRMQATVDLLGDADARETMQRANEEIAAISKKWAAVDEAEMSAAGLCAQQNHVDPLLRLTANEWRATQPAESMSLFVREALEDALEFARNALSEREDDAKQSRIRLAKQNHEIGNLREKIAAVVAELERP